MRSYRVSPAVSGSDLASSLSGPPSSGGSWSYRSWPRRSDIVVTGETLKMDYSKLGPERPVRSYLQAKVGAKRSGQTKWEDSNKDSYGETPREVVGADREQKKPGTRIDIEHDRSMDPSSEKSPEKQSAGEGGDGKPASLGAYIDKASLELFSTTSKYLDAINLSSQLQQVVSDEMKAHAQVDRKTYELLKSQEQRLQDALSISTGNADQSWIRPALEDLRKSINDRAHAHQELSSILFSQSATFQQSLDSHRDVMDLVKQAPATNSDEAAKTHAGLMTFLQATQSFEAMRKPRLKLISELEYLSGQVEGIEQQLKDVDSLLGSLREDQHASQAAWKLKQKFDEARTRQDFLSSRHAQLKGELMTSVAEMESFHSRHKDKLTEVADVFKQHQRRCDTTLRKSISLLQAAVQGDSNVLKTFDPQHGTRRDPQKTDSMTTSSENQSKKDSLSSLLKQPQASLDRNPLKSRRVSFRQTSDGDKETHEETDASSNRSASTPYDFGDGDTRTPGHTEKPRRHVASLQTSVGSPTKTDKTLKASKNVQRKETSSHNKRHQGCEERENDPSPDKHGATKRQTSSLSAVENSRRGTELCGVSGSPILTKDHSNDEIPKGNYRCNKKSVTRNIKSTFNCESRFSKDNYNKENSMLSKEDMNEMKDTGNLVAGNTVQKDNMKQNNSKTSFSKHRNSTDQERNELKKRGDSKSSRVSDRLTVNGKTRNPRPGLNKTESHSARSNQARLSNEQNPPRQNLTPSPETSRSEPTAEGDHSTSSSHSIDSEILPDTTIVLSTKPTLQSASPVKNSAREKVPECTDPKSPQPQASEERTCSPALDLISENSESGSWSKPKAEPTEQSEHIIIARPYKPAQCSLKKSSPGPVTSAQRLTTKENTGETCKQPNDSDTLVSQPANPKHEAMHTDDPHRRLMMAEGRRRVAFYNEDDTEKSSTNHRGSLETRINQPKANSIADRGILKKAINRNPTSKTAVIIDGSSQIGNPVVKSSKARQTSVGFSVPLSEYQNDSKDSQTAPNTFSLESSDGDRSDSSSSLESNTSERVRTRTEVNHDETLSEALRERRRVEMEEDDLLNRLIRKYTNTRRGPPLLSKNFNNSEASAITGSSLTNEPNDSGGDMLFGPVEPGGREDRLDFDFDVERNVPIISRQPKVCAVKPIPTDTSDSGRLKQNTIGSACDAATKWLVKSNYLQTQQGRRLSTRSSSFEHEAVSTVSNKHIFQQTELIARLKQFEVTAGQFVELSKEKIDAAMMTTDPGDSGVDATVCPRDESCRWSAQKYSDCRENNNNNLVCETNCSSQRLGSNSSCGHENNVTAMRSDHLEKTYAALDNQYPVSNDVVSESYMLDQSIFPTPTSHYNHSFELQTEDSKNNEITICTSCGSAGVHLNTRRSYLSTDLGSSQSSLLHNNICAKPLKSCLKRRLVDFNLVKGLEYQPENGNYSNMQNRTNSRNEDPREIKKDVSSFSKVLNSYTSHSSTAIEVTDHISYKQKSKIPKENVGAVYKKVQFLEKVYYSDNCEGVGRVTREAIDLDDHSQNPCRQSIDSSSLCCDRSRDPVLEKDNNNNNNDTSDLACLSYSFLCVAVWKAKRNRTSHLTRYIGGM